MRINQNISSLNAYRNLMQTDNRISKSLERLSSGLRINRAADDAAGLAISEKMRAQVAGLNQAMRNAQDGISLIQTAEGALNETHSILQRMRELSVQAANDTLTLSDRQEIQKEIDQLTEEIDRIGNTTEFNTKKLLDGTTSALVSTDKLTTKVSMRDGLRVMDQFGQKASGGGNYKLSIDATPGTAQIQKTDIMKIKHAGADAVSEVARDQQGVTPQNASYQLDFTDVNSGTFKLQFTPEGGEAQTTADITFDTTAANLVTNIENALAAVDGYEASDFTVSGDSLDNITIEFTGNLAETPLSLEITDSALLDVGAVSIEASVEESTEGIASQDEVQSVSFENVTGGTFTLTFASTEKQNLDLGGATGGTYTLGDGTSTVTLDYDATAAEVQDALETLYGEGNVEVSDEMMISFYDLGEASGLEFDGTELTGATDASLSSVVVTQEAGVEDISNLRSAAGITFDNSVGGGLEPTLVYNDTEGQIGIEEYAGFDWDNVNTTETSTITLTKTEVGSEEKLKVEIQATDGMGNTLDITDEYAELDADGNYVYSGHGVNFQISGDDFDAMGVGDFVEIDLEQAVSSGTNVDVLGAVSTQNDWTTNTAAGVKGVYSFDITANAIADDTIEIGGVTFTSVAAAPGADDFVVGDTINDTAANLRQAIRDSALGADYEVTGTGATITLTQNTADGEDIHDDGDALVIVQTGGALTASNWSVTGSEEAAAISDAAFANNTIELDYDNLLEGADSVQVEGANLASAEKSSLVIEELGSTNETLKISADNYGEDLNGYTITFTQNVGAFTVAVDTGLKTIEATGDFTGGTLGVPSNLTDLETAINDELTSEGVTTGIVLENDEGLLVMADLAGATGALAGGTEAASYTVSILDGATVLSDDVQTFNLDTEEHLGQARFQATLTGTGALETDDVDMTFRIDGEEFSIAQVNVAGGTAAADVATAIADEINGTDGLKDLVTATVVNNDLRIELNEAGKSFAFDWAVTGGDGVVTIDGDLARDMTAHFAKETNLTAMDYEGTNFVDGVYTVATGDSEAAATASVVNYSSYAQADGVTDLTTGAVGAVTADSEALNISLALEVTGINTDTGEISFSYNYTTMAKDGAQATGEGTLTLDEGANAAVDIDGVFTFDTLNLAAATDFTTGDRLVINASAQAVLNDDSVTFSRDGADAAKFVFNNGALGAATDFSFYQLQDDGVLKESEISLEFDTLYEEASAAQFEVNVNAMQNFQYDNHGVSFTLTQTDADSLSLSKDIEYIEEESVDYAYAEDTTEALAYDATAEEIQAALEGLTTIGEGNVTVTGSDGSWSTTFAGDLESQRVNMMEIDGTALEGTGEIGDIANSSTRIYDIDRFWDASGNFLVTDPQTITLVQGDGAKAAFTIFKDDTLEDVVNKINDAIANPKTNNPGTIEVGKGLGQGEIAPEDAQFAYYVSDPSEDGFDSVEGTIVINSAINGSKGEIKFVGDEEVIKALSLTTIRESVENNYEVTVTDAHTGEAVAEDVQVTGNTLVGTVHANVDVEFDSMANVAVSWDDDTKSFSFASEEEDYETFVHLSDNTMVFHIGANPLQDVGAAIGDMRAHALGVDNIMVTDRESANRAITQIDGAISRVSAERSKMGALQNRLDHTISNLAVSAENLTAAESRIRDLDFAQEMMEYTRNQIMMQAGTAMMANANMKSQSVLQLLG